MTTPITKVWGVGTQVQDVLSQNGYQCAEDLAATTEEELVKIHGFGPAKAKKVILSAKSLIPAEPENITVPTDSTVEITEDSKERDKPTKVKKSKKTKQEKKDKKKKKEKKAAKDALKKKTGKKAKKKKDKKNSSSKKK